MKLLVSSGSTRGVSVPTREMPRDSAAETKLEAAARTALRLCRDRGRSEHDRCRLKGMIFLMPRTSVIPGNVSRRTPVAHRHLMAGLWQTILLRERLCGGLTREAALGTAITRPAVIQPC